MREPDNVSARNYPGGNWRILRLAPKAAAPLGGDRCAAARTSFLFFLFQERSL